MIKKYARNRIYSKKSMDFPLGLMCQSSDGLYIACLGGTYKPKIYHRSDIIVCECVHTHFHSFRPHVHYLGLVISSLHVTDYLKTVSNTVSSPASKAPIRSSMMSAPSCSPLVHVFISHDWPSAITELSFVLCPLLDLPDAGSPSIDEIIEKT